MEKSYEVELEMDCIKVVFLFPEGIQGVASPSLSLMAMMATVTLRAAKMSSELPTEIHLPAFDNTKRNGF